MNKNFSCNNQGKRKDSDFYETPYSITKHLLKNETFDGSILEPAVGNGAISRFITNCISYDKEFNFFNEVNNYDNIITNPPFSLAYEFILHAKKIANKKIVMLLPLSYLHGKKRFDNIYNDKIFPLSKIYVFTRYPLLGEKLREDGKYNTGMMVYAWYVWDKEYKGEPIIKWIDNHNDILKKIKYKCNS